MTDPTPGEGQRIAAEARALGLQKYPSQAASEAVEAVLALHQPIDPDSIGRNRRCCSCSAVYGNAAYPCDTVQAIRQHLPEAARTEGDDQ